MKFKSVDHLRDYTPEEFKSVYGTVDEQPFCEAFTWMFSFDSPYDSFTATMCGYSALAMIQPYFKEVVMIHCFHRGDEQCGSIRCFPIDEDGAF